MSLVHDRCICLRKIEYSETSQILLLMSRAHGLQRVLAKGAHRRTKAGSSKFDGGVDLLDVGEAVFSQRLDKDLGLLTEWSLREGHLELRRDLRAMYLGLYAVELTGLLFEEHDPHPDVFDRLEQTLGGLSTPRRETALLAFELDLLRDSGYLPEFAACVNCGRVLEEDEQVYFTAAQGGIVCRDCELSFPDRLAIEARLLRIVRAMVSGSPRSGEDAPELPVLDRQLVTPINRLLADHVQHTLGRGLRMANYVLQ